MDLNNKKILIAGGAMGIGRATALCCAEAGASVIIADFNNEAGHALAKELAACFIQVDVSNEDSVKAMYTEIENQFGSLDVLLHTAGVMKGAHIPMDEFTLDTWRSVIDINLTGSFLCAKYAVPLMKKAGQGVIVLTSSIAATAGSSSFAYGSSKGGVTSLGLTLAKKLEADKIRVNVLSPGDIDTGMKRTVLQAEAERKHGDPAAFNTIVNDSNLGKPEGVAKVLAWLASDDADYVRGLISTR
jgi:meso-butanediol dehydrogenase/(S,S)-butanediol dehydrogenase/diacetyl reductase